ncbi:AraC family transcriptional regulator [Brumimicrobium glaciale]|uniref:AraC family transcriptional regulator n=1 Tax=Brumimicrobium glaciale TaxID=200475 RepID=A0A4Q4KUI0_9FLAO|nr:AraC family transcriptional regulator [Brumimicrobium glaciale]RYM35794.1 AraC family transcriptional regulator [Brumimicrobium glaciale]
MREFKVNSLPLKDVIESLSRSFNVPFKENCDEFSLAIPSRLGIGQIRGVNFDNGLGIITYDCQFYEDIRIKFTVDEVHPIKYLYSAQGSIKHSFANESEVHKIDQFKCAIVASEKSIGHILTFAKNENHKILSLEIDREKFSKNAKCEINSLGSKLKALFKDTLAEKTFYHEGFYGLEFKDIFTEILKYEDKMLIRKYHMESIALRIFVNQIIQYEDDLSGEDKSSIIRVNELNKVDELNKYIQLNLDKDLTILSLSQQSGLNPNKLQFAFKHMFKATVNEYVTHHRLEESKRLLQNKNLNISEVLGKVGFESNSYFSKIFKREFDMSPSEYRKLVE